MNKEIVIDANGCVLGRIAARAAKQALLGRSVTVVNCEDAIITGRKAIILEKYRAMRAKGGSSQKGPIFSKTPERIMKRTIRGMLSHRQGRGEQAFARVMCYNKTLLELKSAEKISLKRQIKTRFITLKELSGEL